MHESISFIFQPEGISILDVSLRWRHDSGFLGHGCFCIVVISGSDMRIDFFWEFKVDFCLFPDRHFFNLHLFLYSFSQLVIMLNIFLSKHRILSLFDFFNISWRLIFEFLYQLPFLLLLLLLCNPFPFSFFLFLQQFQSFVAFFIPFVPLQLEPSSLFVDITKNFFEGSLLLLFFLLFEFFSLFCFESHQLFGSHPVILVFHLLFVLKDLFDVFLIFGLRFLSSCFEFSQSDPLN